MIEASTVLRPRKVPTIGVDVKPTMRTGPRREGSQEVKCEKANPVDEHSKTKPKEVSKSTSTHTSVFSQVSQSRSGPKLNVENTAPGIKIDCTKRIPSSEISYDTVFLVLGSWQDKILRIPNWSLPTGISFLRHIFRLAPVTITLFGFPPDTKYDDPKLSENPKFTTKGARLIKAIDMAAMFLGPDLEPFEQELYSLGWRHIAMQARPEYWPAVGEALLCTFEDHMIGGFTQEERNAWTIIYNFMGYHMIVGLKDHLRKRGELDEDAPEKDPAADDAMEELNSKRKHVERMLSRSTSYRHSLQCTKEVPLSSISYDLVTVVIESWRKILAIPEWKKVTGDLFLRYIFKIEPGTIELFNFPADTDYLDPDLTNDIKIRTKGELLIKAIDTAVQLLGPDLYPLEGVLFDLGRRHVIMNAQPEFWPLVGEALFLVFEECMGEDGFSPAVRNAWTVMYNFLGYHMIKGLRYQYAEMAKRSTGNVSSKSVPKA